MKPARLCRTCGIRKPPSAFAAPRARRCGECVTVFAGKPRADRTVSRCGCCGVTKPRAEYPRPAARKCTACLNAPPPARSCQRCGEMRPADTFVPGGRVCVSCRAIPLEHKPRACVHCHVVKQPDAFDWGPGNGRGCFRRRRAVCRDCMTTEAAVKAAAHTAWRTTFKQDGHMVRLCRSCGEVKDLETGFYITRRRPRVERDYRCKQCQIARISEHKRRVLTDPAVAVELRERQREWQRAWRRRNPERARELERIGRQRRNSDPEQHARALEATRIRYRLKRERRDGVPVTEQGTQRAAVKAVMPRDLDAKLPSAPLAAVIDTFAQREQASHPLGYHFDDDSRDSRQFLICERVGVSNRLLYAWRIGERPMASFDQADRVLTELGLLWWDVFNEQTVRRSVLDVRRYMIRRRRLDDGRVARYRQLTGIVRIGDAGPDHDVLRAVAEVFEGDRVVAA